MSCSALDARLLLQAAELAEARLEDAGHAERRGFGARDVAIEAVQVAARPEARFELAGGLRAPASCSRRFSKMTAHDATDAISSSASTSLDDGARVENQAEEIDKIVCYSCVSTHVDERGRKTSGPAFARVHARDFREPFADDLAAGLACDERSGRTGCARRAPPRRSRTRTACRSAAPARETAPRRPRARARRRAPRAARRGRCLARAATPSARAP